jgi:C-terminal processing protease CtpA/Prc
MRPSGRLLLLFLFLSGPRPLAAQVTGFERQRAHIMLDVMRDDIRKNYFDTTYGGVDLAAVFDTARARLDRATALGQLIGAIAQAALELNDSHTAFLPPGLVYRADYGWQMRFVGDTCRILRVKEASDAQAKGVLPGDAVLAIEGFQPTRANLWQLQYLLNAIRPLAVLHVTLRAPGSEPRQLEIAAKVIERRHIVDPRNSIDLGELLREEDDEWTEGAPRWAELDERVVAWRVKGFYADNGWVDAVLKSARRHQVVVLDLRGNPGGAVFAELRLLSGLYADKLTVADEIDRRSRKPMVAAGSGASHSEARLIVLVDAGSGSASEIFARTMQLTQRGTVIGDRTEGAVRESRVFVHSVGTETVAFYGTSVTIADLVMPDGGRLEGGGVTPDEIVLPSGEDLRDQRDPALARALTLAGVATTPAQAGRLDWHIDK